MQLTREAESLFQSQAILGLARPQIQDTVNTVNNQKFYTQTATACKQPRRFRQIFLPAGD